MPEMQSSFALFSIILPFFNSEEYIGVALNSVVAQTFADWELIAVNDGSTDRSLSIVQSMKEPRIRVITKPNGGYATAVRKGLDVALGKYVLFLGSDDLLFPDTLLRLAKEIKQQQEPDILAFNTQKRIFESGQMVEDVVTNYQEPLRFDGTLLELETAHPHHFLIHYARDTSKCFKRATIGSIRHFGCFGVSSDNAFSVLVGMQSRHFSFLPFSGYLWNVRNNSVGNRKPTSKSAKDALFVWNQFYGAILSSQKFGGKYPVLIRDGYLKHYRKLLNLYGKYLWKNPLFYTRSVMAYITTRKQLSQPHLSFIEAIGLWLPVTRRIAICLSSFIKKPTRHAR